MLVLGTVTWNPSRLVFHGLQDSAEQSRRTAIPNFNLILLITRLLRLMLVKRDDDRAQLIPKRHQHELVLPRVSKWYRNINLFPFRAQPIRRALRTD